jgi:hypothetical protein
MRPVLIAMVLISLGLSAFGCRHVRIDTPDSFIEVEEGRRSQYAYRATSADGVVVAVRRIENDRRGTLEFWAEAVRNKMRDVRGYALIEESDVNARGGMPGKQMRFGRDESGHTYSYWVTIFVRNEGRKPKVWIIEAGGQSDVFDQRRESIEEMVRSFEPR